MQIIFLCWWFSKLVSGRSVSVIEETLGHELTFLSEWLVDNELFIHLRNTESIIFGSNEKIRKQSTMKIICEENEVAAKDKLITWELAWTSHREETI